MAHRRNLHDEDNESKHLCDTDSYEYVEDTESDEDEYYYDKGEQPSLPLQQKQITKWGPPSQADQTCVHQFAGSDRRKKQNQAQHISKASLPLCVSMLYFTCYWSPSDVDYRHYQQYLDRRDGTTNPLQETTDSKMFLFLAIIVQIGHDIRDRLRD